MILILTEPITEEHLSQLTEEYSDYIKMVVDVDQKRISAGGEYHIDCEEVLTRTGSKQSHLFGGGVDISTMVISYSAMSNYKPQFGHVTHEVADENVRTTMKQIIQSYFPNAR